MTIRLFLDVDGVINADQPQGWGRTQNGVASAYGQGWKIRWAPAMVKALFDLGLSLTWATTWKRFAPLSIAPLIGQGHNANWLEEPQPPPLYGYSEAGSIGWKFGAMQLEDVSEGFVWIDDEIADNHKAWAKSVGGLAIQPKYRTGISPSDIARIEDYIKTKEE